jgi:hypothetical protein
VRYGNAETTNLDVSRYLRFHVPARFYIPVAHRLITNIYKLTKSCRLSGWWQKLCNDLFSPSLNPSFTPIPIHSFTLLIADQANPLLFLLCFFFYHSFYIPFLVFIPPSSFLPLPLERMFYWVNLWQMRNPMDGRKAFTELQECCTLFVCLFVCQMKQSKTTIPSCFLRIVKLECIPVALQRK